MDELTGNLLEFAEKIRDMTTYPAWNQDYDADTRDRILEAQRKALRLYEYVRDNTHFEGYEIGLKSR